MHFRDPFHNVRNLPSRNVLRTLRKLELMLDWRKWRYSCFYTSGSLFFEEGKFMFSGKRRKHLDDSTDTFLEVLRSTPIRLWCPFFQGNKLNNLCVLTYIQARHHHRFASLKQVETASCSGRHLDVRVYVSNANRISKRMSGLITINPRNQ